MNATRWGFPTAELLDIRTRRGYRSIESIYVASACIARPLPLLCPLPRVYSWGTVVYSYYQRYIKRTQ